MSEPYVWFFGLEGSRTIFLGLWALTIIMCAPFAWAWDDFGRAGEPWTGGAPRFDWGPLVLGLSFPFWPVMVCAIPLALAILFLIVGVPHYLGRWWNADWSRR